MMAYRKPAGNIGGVPMNSTDTVTSPEFFPEDFKAHALDRIGRNAAEFDGDATKVGCFLREPAHQPDVAALQPDLARPGSDAMASSALEEIRPSLGKRASRGPVRFLIVFSIGVCTTLAWQWYGDPARAMLATSWPQLASLASEPTPAPEQIAAAPQVTISPELQQLKEDLALLKQELQQLKEIPAALASLRQSVDQLAGSQQQLAGSQQQIAGTIAQLAAQKPASLPRPAPAPKPLMPPSAPKPLTPPAEIPLKGS